MTAEPELPVVPEEQAELRRSLEVGLVRIEGHLALLTQRDEQSAKNTDDLTQRVSGLERSRWPLPAIAALTAVGALVVALWQVLGR
ncbi:hypothetical protein [Streptomyces tsukubensis]|uniref:Uncharacterized protein n=1 Tax=Streptomyces tsukubensis TaxID=83656 RepID=A0A1V4AF37_9ACTN|nr:hypothetical protein [Streptomyces tsukubensis]OON82213.1 hypothetical protein B1H18_04010 [Streptomyces tsukubensis]QFR92700.1 hypothetical protein GBW32_06030 [Streptomyces tsukubensis]